MLRTSSLSLAIVLSGTFAVSLLAYGQLGGSDGVLIPYTGHLDRAGTPANGAHDFAFAIYPTSAAGSACWSGTESGVPVSGGAFSVVLGPVPEGCVVGQDMYVGVEVRGPDDAGFVSLAGRHRIHASPSAHTSGPESDFYVEGELDVAGRAYLSSTADASLTGDGALTLGDLGGANLTLDGNEIVARSGASGGLLYLQNDPGAGDTIVNTNAGRLGVGTTGPAAKLHVAGDARIDGEVSWSCPPGTARVGSWCMTENRSDGQTDLGPALEDCHDLGMQMCPMSAILLCDQRNAPGGPGQCGTVTDLPTGGIVQWVNERILTGDVVMPSDASLTNAFTSAACFSSNYDDGVNEYANRLSACGTGRYYFCCSPVNP